MLAHALRVRAMGWDVIVGFRLRLNHHATLPPHAPRVADPSVADGIVSAGGAS
ncbi:MAG: hypothetical protein K2J07_06685 [Muribaculaceae bacterium]|nr:hypothetical protein [Muribaculaceae bacterium]